MREGAPAAPRWRRLALMIGLPVLLLGGCVAMLIPRADPGRLTEAGSYEVCTFSCEASSGAWEATGRGGPSNPCRWVRMNGPQVIAEGEVDSGETVRVTLVDGETFMTSESCLPWIEIN